MLTINEIKQIVCEMCNKNLYTFEYPQVIYTCDCDSVVVNVFPSQQTYHIAYDSFYATGTFRYKYENLVYFYLTIYNYNSFLIMNESDFILNLKNKKLTNYVKNYLLLS